LAVTLNILVRGDLSCEMQSVCGVNFEFLNKPTLSAYIFVMVRSMQIRRTAYKGGAWAV